MRGNTRHVGFIFALTAGFAINGWCQQDSGQAPAIYDRIWGAALLYDNPANTVIQSFALIGRYHGQYWTVAADQGDADDWENRRTIAGFSSGWFQHFTVQAQIYMKNDGGSFYDGLYEAFIKWSPADAGISLSVGRLDYLYTGFERSESSKKINVIERGLLVNQVMPGRSGGRAAGRRKRIFFLPCGGVQRRYQRGVR